MSRLELTIHGVDARARGVARLPEAGDRLVLVPGAWPGERVAIQIVRRGRPDRPAIATLLEVLEPHPARREPPCPHHAARRDGKCTGCPLMTLDEAGQRAIRISIAEAQGLSVGAVEHGEPTGYRWSVKRVVGGRPGDLVIGSYVAGSHRVADMRECQVDHPRLVACIEEARVAANDLALEPFDEETGRGDLRYLWLKTDGERVLLTLITASAESRTVDELPSRLSLPTGIAWSIQSGGGNAVRGGVATPLVGDEALALEIAGERVTAGPLGFLQPNPAVAGQAYRALVDGPGPDAPEGGLALDLYAGAGVTTRLLGERFSRVLACERHPESAAELGIEALDAADFLQARRSSGDRPALVVANPPRAGMGGEVCDHLAALEPERLHIMSCSAATLATDIERLRRAGYRLEGLRAFDTLPQTNHLELVAWLSRDRSEDRGSHDPEASYGRSRDE